MVWQKRLFFVLSVLLLFVVDWRVYMTQDVQDVA